MDLRNPEAHNGSDSPQPGPFGYSFLSPMDTPYEPAPARPPGPALLDDNESTMLDNFFTTMNSNHFPSDFWMEGQTNRLLGTSGLDWPGELPPTFEGSTTSLSQPGLPHGSMDKSSMEMLAPDMNTNAEIFAAASMLYHNGLTGNDFNSSFNHHNFASPDADFNNPRMNGHGKVQAPSSHSQSKQPSRRRMPVGFHTSEMLFDVREPISPEQQVTAKVRPLHWGSDVGFMGQGYLAPPEQPNEEDRTKELLGHLVCLEPQSSATNTRAPSPVTIRHTGGYDAPWADAAAAGQLSNLRRGFRDHVEDLAQPKKKQRTLVKEEDDETSDDDTSRQKPKKSKSSTRRLSQDTLQKRRLSSGPKAARENLTEEQKRSNHILSEQKRRNLIRQGFDDLCLLVPGLKGGGFSKSAMLTQAADWLEEILRGNEILKAQLAEMKSMNGLVMPR
ncbi:putative HLH transcription factor [Aspergillus japonicus CBS 114.51]|uniref:Putative HLH transcription factor n=2 Tax=Aspergillus TaxID=5052 RepID=A0A2V5HJK2_ASPV1|nr:putative HLH transcription factor [Aspergillus japonicus CBS 114.51]PYI24648.1 putative HLH transcription factor [Aspergillus violaceofuscus CBS 115571]RAH79547.1 putative HLH transcription factor [Aspergillus japonicus CBS 114.51]